MRRIAILLACGAGIVGQSLAEIQDRSPKRSIPEIGPLGPVPEPPDNPTTEAKVALGKLLYFDKRLSGDGQFSCADCHAPEKGWGTGEAISKGYPGTRHWRNSQTILNSAYYPKLFWGGESTSLESQADAAITGNLAGNADPEMIEERLAQIPEYVGMFQAAFGIERPKYPHVLRAIAAFERAVPVSRNVPFDRGALSEKAKRGMELFRGKANCIQCHNGPMFTDFSFHNTGVPKNDLFEKDPFAQIALRFQHYSRGATESEYRKADRDLGLYYTTRVPADRGRFRTPSLRELRYTGPFMHNGAFEVLEEVVDFYDAGGGDDPNKSSLLKPLHLTDEEKEALLEFLDSLSGDEILVDPPKLPDYAVMPEKKR